MAELALKNPEIPSRVLIDNIMDHIETKNGGEYLRKVIQGYVILMYDKIDRYYSAMVGSPLTPDVLADSAGNVPMKEWVGVLVKVEMELMNDPKISTKKYIHRLRKFKMQPKWIKYENENKWYNPIENRIVYNRNPEPGNTRKIHIATRMSKLMNPSHSSRTLSDNSTTLSSSSSIPFEPNSSHNNNPYFNSPRTSPIKYSRSPQYPSSSPQYHKRTPSSNSASKRKHPVLDNNNSSKTRRA